MFQNDHTHFPSNGKRGLPDMPETYPAAYLDGLRLFNDEEFFECHDVLEEIWRETVGDEKLFYKALIHAAVALYHFGEGNLGGARKMCGSCCRYLEPYGPRYMGLDVERFLRDFRGCFQELLDAEGNYPSGLTLQPERIPRIPLPLEPESARPENEPVMVEQQRLKRHVGQLASAPRPCGSDRLESCRRYVAACLEQAGWSIERHPFRATSEEGIALEGVNLIARRADLDVEGGPRFCIGAHLDSRPETPGADDNSSAVAALLELARVLPQTVSGPPRVGLELVVFDLEENGMLGGAEHARLTRERGIDLCGMVSLEMLGYCDNRPGSQALPRALVGMYPDTGDFIAVIGNQASHRLIECYANGLRAIDGLPVETLAVPDNGNGLQASRLSDHSPFWDAGYAALMITDTSFLRNPHYHLPGDTPETLDMEFLTRVTRGCVEAVRGIVAEGL